MFNRIVVDETGQINSERVRALFQAHPVQINILLELGWSVRQHANGNVVLGQPDRRSDLRALPDCLLDGLLCSFTQQGSGGTPEPFIRATWPNVQLWPHWIYAFLIENTRIYEIFRKVIQGFSYGETLGAPQPETQHWLRITEELFYRMPAPFLISTVDSNIRPDQGATRRNGYWRMFGMELNHPTEKDQVYPLHKPDAANTEFVNVFENLLHHIYIGIINVSTTSGPNPTDDSSIFNFANQLRDMLLMRRQYGRLSREEYWFVCMMSWFHLTLEQDNPVVRDLRAEGPSPEQRLFNIAKRVGCPAHSKSEQFFRMAPLLSQLLNVIESDGVGRASDARILYDAAAPGSLRNLNFQIIADWEQSSGHNIRKRDYSNVK
ncbi:MAG: hypothetical protein IPM58_02850 [Nitrospira sp.]|nr:hypothetical protein [Nitrospira sp.]